MHQSCAEGTGGLIHMKNISLLPIEIKNYHKSDKKRNYYIALALAVIAVFIAVYGLLSFAVLARDGELYNVKSQRAVIQNKLGQLKPYQDMLTEIQDQNTKVVKAMANSPAWGELFTGLYDKIPGNVWLSSFSARYGGNTGECVISGWANNPASVSKWLSTMESGVGLSNVQCQFAETDAESVNSKVQFEIKAAILPGKSYKPVVKEDKPQ
jgi:Tfp pilus assembly protein PilN